MAQAAGKLNHRIRLESLETSQDANGETVETWTHEGDVWANVSPVSGKEFISSAAMQSQIVARITVRYRSDIQATWRILFRNRYYNIEAVLADVVSGVEYLTLPCSLGVIADIPIAPQALTVPDGFDWNPPITVYGLDGVFTTDFLADDWKVSATADVWVSTTGNDTTGNGTQGLPYRSIVKGLTSAAALPDASVNLFIQSGEYASTFGWNGTACDKNLNIVGVGGDVITSVRATTAITWTLVSPGTYSGTRASVSTVRDELFKVDNSAIVMPRAASQASCQSTPGTFFTSGSTLFIHTLDGRQPDSQVRIMLVVPNVVFSANKKWYLENIIMEGGGANPFACSTSTIGLDARVVFNNCEARYATENATGFSCVGIPLVISNGTESHSNGGDGFGYTVGVNVISPKYVEIGCRGFNCGTTDAVNNDNGTTSHNDCRGLRVNGQYFNSVGPVIADINTVQSWNIGCAANDSISTLSNNDTGFRVLNTAQMWLDTCTATGSVNAAVTDSTSFIRHRASTLQGVISGNVETY